MIIRPGLNVKPYLRLTEEHLGLVHATSMEILKEIGLLVRLLEAIELFNSSGARVEKTETPGIWRVKISESMVWEALEKAPKKVYLGARDPANVLLLDGREPRVYFGSGSESNYCLETSLEAFVRREDPSYTAVFPTYSKKRGTAKDLCKAAHLAEHLTNLDFFVHPLNIQDEDITEENKDVNKFFACLDNITKHVMAGLTSLEQLDRVIKLAEIVAGGQKELQDNPLISFISCVTKSPLQLIDDATAKMLAVIRKGLPIVLSSSPQGGSTAPLDEMGMVSQINAEILGAVTLSQLARPGAAVIYGSVPVRARMDNLHDMYGAPEFNQYNVDCVQMARYYGLPCYSTGGVADAKVPGIQASVEKLLSHLFVTQSGPHLLHYAFGLLEETQTFSFEQSLLDNEHIGMVKMLFSEPAINSSEGQRSLDIIRRVMDSPYRLFARYARRQLHGGGFYLAYPFEGGEDKDETMIRVKEKMEEILSLSPKRLPQEIRQRIFEEIPGVLVRLY